MPATYDPLISASRDMSAWCVATAHEHQRRLDVDRTRGKRSSGDEHAGCVCPCYTFDADDIIIFAAFIDIFIRLAA